MTEASPNQAVAGEELNEMYMADGEEGTWVLGRENTEAEPAGCMQWFSTRDARRRDLFWPQHRCTGLAPVSRYTETRWVGKEIHSEEQQKIRKLASYCSVSEGRLVGLDKQKVL